MASLQYATNLQPVVFSPEGKGIYDGFPLRDIVYTHVIFGFSATNKHNMPMGDVVKQFQAFIHQAPPNISVPQLAEALGVDDPRRITDLFMYGWTPDPNGFGRHALAASAAAESMLPHESGKNAVTTVFAITAIFATLAVGLRIWSREVLSMKLMIHDWFMILGYFLSLVYGIISVIHAAELMPAVTVWDLTWNTYAEVQKYQTILSALYPVPLFLIKSSLLLFYLQLCPSYPSERRSIFRTAIYGTFIFILVTAISNLFVILLQCERVDYWNEELETRCNLNPKMSQIILGAIGVVTDMLMWLMPLPLVWKLKLGRRENFLAVITFGLGAVVCVVGAFRLNAIQQYGYVTDGRVLTSIVNLLTIVELNLAIICASAPAIRALILHYIPRVLTAYSQRNSKTSSKGSKRKDDEEQTTYTIQVGINVVGRGDSPTTPSPSRELGGNTDEGPVPAESSKRSASPPGILRKLA
ncbi:hypothetical protein TWF694_004721 [Orbilia ellipsospora]|uniref:Rhodopsin domain-containing protein n=1 Tax=Orbilia ellipsospora TaxID=2528407 RepID=A0AAV9WXG3_9PEZI